ncbi:MAG TPA: tetratricopeptide repeat protein [Woeseiaceae bacterium]|nr:tetratricopeptide repeat protein [Woeseiaceae bacterium]
MNLLENLRQRKIVQWGLAYLAAAWMLLQLIDVLGGHWGITDSLARGVDVVLILGFFVALVLAWYHGEQGRQRVSGPEILIIAGLCGVAGLLLPLLDSSDNDETAALAVASESPATVAGSSIAVLPFSIRSDEKQDEYFAAGIHDELVTNLAKIEGLKVISRQSVMQYADTEKSSRQIAAELGVVTLLEGAVQRGGDRIRVSAYLTSASDDERIWAASYDEQLTVASLFQIQSRLASKIASALNAELLPGVQARIDYLPTENLAAWNLAVRGKYLLDKSRNQKNMEAAVSLFREAIDEDPEFSPAWSGLARSIFELSSWHYWDDDVLAESEDAAHRALVLDPDNSEAYATLGSIYRLYRHFEKSEEALRKALQLSPGDAAIRSLYSESLRDSGRLDEAVAEARRSVAIDPRLMRIREILIQNLYFNRNWAEAVQEAREMLELEPDSAYAWYWIGLASAMAGNNDEAIAASKMAVDVGGNAPYLASGQAFTYAVAGEADLATGLLATAEEDGWPLVEIALVYAWLPDLDQAFAYVNRALDERPSSMMYLNTDPSADPMRKDERWQILAMRLQEPADERF